MKTKTHPLRIQTDTGKVRHSAARLNKFIDEKPAALPTNFPSLDLYLILAVIDNLLDHYESTGPKK